MEKLVNDLFKVTKRLEKNLGSVKRGDKKLVPLIDNEADIREILATLRDTISGLIEMTAKNNEVTKTVTNLESKMRLSEDNADHHHQRSLRGKFFITFHPSSPVSTSAELASRQLNVMEYAKELILSKYDVEVPCESFKTCHLTKKGLIFRLDNLAPFSPYARLTQAIKTKNKITTHFINFSLTPLRSSLLYDLRKYKKEGLLEKYFTD